MKQNHTKRNVRHKVKFCCFIAMISLIIGLISPYILSAQTSWQVKLKVEAENARSELVFGADATASDGFDNIWETYALLGGDLWAYFPHPEWNMAHDMFWRDIRASDSNSNKTWFLTIEANPDSSLVNREVTITWNRSMMPAQRSIILTDQITGEQIDMQSTASYSFVYTDMRTLLIAVSSE